MSSILSKGGVCSKHISSFSPPRVQRHPKLRPGEGHDTHPITPLHSSSWKESRHIRVRALSFGFAKIYSTGPVAIIYLRNTHILFSPTNSSFSLAGTTFHNLPKQERPGNPAATASMAADSSAKAELLPLLGKASVLSFGSFTLKSGRVSPYFFNSSLCHTASLLAALSRAYASVLTSPPFSLPLGTEEAGSEADGKFAPHYDIIFGPAYKGISLSALATRELEFHGPAFSNVSYSFNRKEAKDHGEGGTIVGAPLSGKRVVIIDDVMTAGTALREAVSIIKAQGGEVVGVVLLLTRQERVSDEEPRSATKIAEDDLAVPVRAVLTFDDILEAIKAGKIEGVGEEYLEQMRIYREKYGSKD